MDTTQTIYISILLIVVALASFGLGRLSSADVDVPEGVLVQSTFTPPVYHAMTSDGSSEEPEVLSGQLVASVNGTKYHYPWCSGAQRIKDDNKVWFVSADDAQAAGYAPAANCKGL